MSEKELNSPIKWRIAIFASGSGTNAENIAEYFSADQSLEVAAIVCNKKGAGVIERAKRLEVPLWMIDRTQFYESEELENRLEKEKVDLIVLAGFLWKVPAKFLQRFSGRVLNIHPSLLPKFGGKKMYGMNVHQSVKASGDDKTGITIHIIDEEYDKGEIVFQANCPVVESDTPEDIAQKVHALEHRYFPFIIKLILEQRASN